MNLITKKFEELSASEVYEILKSRSEIFMLEQKIHCQDMDDLDYVSLHCFFIDDRRVIAYLRAFATGENTVKIGRVLTLSHGKGIGKELLEKSLVAIKKQLNCKKVIVSAQEQAIGFYKKSGFELVSDLFLEEGIPHAKMELEL